MLGMIRSARSRLQRDSVCEDSGSSGGAVKRAGSVSGATAAAGTIRSRGHLLTRSRSALGQRKSERPDLAISENAPLEKAQAFAPPTTVLGDATNRLVFGQRPVTAPEATKPMIPAQFTRVSPPSAAVPTQEPVIETTPAAPQNAEEATEYVEDIFQVLKREEVVNLPSAGYMETQQHVNAKMRAILIDWLVDVHRKYKLRPETLFLAVHLVDRYLDIQVTARRQLQLVGVTALLIAAKFEEVYPPCIKDFVYVTDKAYSKDDICQMEVIMLNAVEYKICHPTAMHFLERYQIANGCTDAHRDLAQYLLELTLAEYKMLKHAPSHLAAASILLSNKLLRRPTWTPAAVRQTGMTEPMLKECAKEMCNILECAEANPLQAVRKKFSQLKHHSVAKLNFLAAPGSQGPGVRRSSTGGMASMA